MEILPKALDSKKLPRLYETQATGFMSNTDNTPLSVCDNTHPYFFSLNCKFLFIQWALLNMSRWTEKMTPRDIYVCMHFKKIDDNCITV